MTPAYVYNNDGSWRSVSDSLDLTATDAASTFQGYPAVGDGGIDGSGLSVRDGDTLMWADTDLLWTPTVVSASVWVDVAEYDDPGGPTANGNAIVIGWGSVEEFVVEVKRPEVKVERATVTYDGARIGASGNTDFLGGAAMNVTNDQNVDAHGNRRIVIGNSDAPQNHDGPFIWDYERSQWQTRWDGGTFKLTLDFYDGATISTPEYPDANLPLGPRGFPLLWPALYNPVVGLFTVANSNITLSSWGWSFTFQQSTGISVGAGQNGALHR